MIDRKIVFRSGWSLVLYLVLAAGTVVAQDAPRAELGARLAENHGDGAGSPCPEGCSNRLTYYWEVRYHE